MRSLQPREVVECRTDFFSEELMVVFCRVDDVEADLLADCFGKSGSSWLAREYV
jgi:hypothetical protein